MGATSSGAGGADRADVTAFYDEYVDRQTTIGVNRRHEAIVAWLKRFGLRPDSNVLEIGCGVGTLTQLLADALPRGSVQGLDLSPKSIAAAGERLAAFDNVRLAAADVLDADIDGEYDVVVLPDVIEHVPLEMHDALFGRVASWVKKDGFVLLHYPNPHHLEWYHAHAPEKLQIVDQPIHADALLSNVYRHGLYLDYFERYSIWFREGDYVVAVLRPSFAVKEFTRLPQSRPSFAARAVGRLARPWRRLVGNGRGSRPIG
jgi:cyclopropane fatty-acyl-phospholipid synthase-like methyltransferase